MDLQVAVILQLGGDATQLLVQLSRLARFLRPMRLLILEALNTDARLGAVLNGDWRSTARKSSHQPTTRELTATFLGVQDLDTRESVDEIMAVELALVRPREQPRHWKWRLRVRVHATHLTCGDEVELAFLEVWYTPGARLGQLKAGAQERTHRFCMGKGGQLLAGTAELHANRICTSHHYGCPVWYPQLVTSEAHVLELRSFASVLFRWQVTDELTRVMRLVSSFIL